jgi:hypothetical protein
MEPPSCERWLGLIDYDKEQNLKNVLRSVVFGWMLITSVGCGLEEGQPVISELLRAELTTNAGESEVNTSLGEGQVTAFAPAPNLSSVKVLGVCSANFRQLTGYDCENVSGLYSTYADHGGAWMQVITDEIGYRIWGQATLGGSVLQQLGSQPIYYSGTNTVAGYRRWWKADGYQNGQFVYTASSINAGPTLQAIIQIQ